MANWWKTTGWKYGWVFCTFVLPLIIAGAVYSAL